MDPRQIFYTHPDQQGIGEKIKLFLLGIIGLFSSFLASIRAREIRLQNRSLVVQKQLGEGGFSFVYLVKDKSNGTLYALKRVNTELPEHEAMLNQEIKAYKQVQSPYIIKLIDSKIIQNSGRTVEGLLLLPFYKNGTVQDLIDKTPNGDIPLRIICSICSDICKGLRAFHSQNLSFRDLKPANVLLDDSNRAVLMDLGSVDTAKVTISSRRESITLQEHCSVTCTAPFRAPELFDPPSHCIITDSSDIWSLGCTIYALAYGQSPFDGSATAAISGNVSFPIGDKYGPAFQTLISQILQTNSSLRLSLVQVETALSKIDSAAQFTKEDV